MYDNLWTHLHSVKPVVGLVRVVKAVVGLGFGDDVLLEELSVGLKVFVLETCTDLKPREKL